MPLTVNGVSIEGSLDDICPYGLRSDHPELTKSSFPSWVPSFGGSEYLNRIHMRSPAQTWVAGLFRSPKIKETKDPEHLVVASGFLSTVHKVWEKPNFENQDRSRVSNILESFCKKIADQFPLTEPKVLEEVPKPMYAGPQSLGGAFATTLTGCWPRSGRSQTHSQG